MNASVGAARRRKLAAAGAAALALSLWSSASVARGTTAEEVEAAWRRHADLIRSIEYSVLQSEEDWEVIPEPNAGGGDKIKIVAMRQVTGAQTFAREGAQVALARKMEWSEEGLQAPLPIRQRFWFDGSRNISLQEGTLISQAVIRDAQEPSRELKETGHLAPLWLAHWPLEQLHQSEINAGELRVSGEHVEVSGRETLELIYPIQGSDRAINRIYVDEAKDYHIAKLIYSFGGVAYRTMEIDYVADDRIGWRPRTWRSTLLTETGHAEQVVKNVVTACSVNEPLDGRFKVEFPVGTNVNDNGLFFVQGPDGEEQPMAPRDFGKGELKKVDR
jgi:hypothetical protein